MYDRDAITAAVDLPSLADELVGPRRLDPGPPTWRCPADTHARRPSGPAVMVVFTSRAGEQRWQCTTCGAGETAIDLVAATQAVSLGDALAYLARRTGITRSARTGRVATGPAASADRAGLDAWATRAAELLWQPLGEPARRWLIEVRGLPADVLRTNRVGATTITPADRFPTRRAIPGRRQASPAAVLPARQGGSTVFAQLRLIDSPGDGYLNPPGTHLPPPTIGLYRPATRRGPEIVVTEGVIDALSANAAGYRAVVTFGPARVGPDTARAVARLDGPLVVAFDPDAAGRAATERLTGHLSALGRRPAVLTLPHEDLNAALAAASDWPRKLDAFVREAAGARPGPALGL